jgi:hypothetical protein
MLLGIPISTDTNGSTYNFPFLHNIKCPGIYHLNPCYISNIAVIKGGDQQQIAYNQQMGIVDVRIDFGSLFNSMLADEHGRNNTDRPNLNSYLKALGEAKGLKYSVPESTIDPYNPGDNPDDLWTDPENPNPLDPNIVIPVNRDPDEELTKKLFLDAVKNAGSLKKAIDDGLAIPKDMAKQLYNEGYITLPDLMESFPDISVDELDELIGDITDGGFTSVLTDEQIKKLGINMYQNIIDTANYLNLPKNNVFTLGQGLINNVNNVANNIGLPVDKVISSDLSFIESMQNSISNSMGGLMRGGSSLLATTKSLTNKLNMSTDSVLGMSDSLFSNLKNGIGAVQDGLTDSQIFKSGKELLSSLGDKLTTNDGFNLLTKLKGTVGDLNLTSGINLVNKVRDVADGDIFASLDLVENVKKLSNEFGLDQNSFLSSSIDIFDNITDSVNETGVLDNSIVKGGIDLFKTAYNKNNSYNLSLFDSSSLFSTSTKIASDLGIPGAKTVETGINIFDSYTNIQNTLDMNDKNALATGVSVLENVQDISNSMGITQDSAVKAGSNVMGNLSNISSDVDTMMKILKT